MPCRHGSSRHAGFYTSVHGVLSLILQMGKGGGINFCSTNFANTMGTGTQIIDVFLGADFGSRGEECYHKKLPQNPVLW